MSNSKMEKFLAHALILSVVGSLLFLLGFIIPLLLGYPVTRVVALGVIGGGFMLVGIPMYLIANKKS